MTSEIEYWKKFWDNKKDPLHTQSNSKYYKDYGKEISTLIPSNVSTVLELGCGSGSLYEPLGFDKLASYVGIDLSEGMLQEFNSMYPDIVLHQGSADSYKDSNLYDLIFTNGVIQYLSLDMLKRQIKNALTMLNDGGMIIHSSIPWKAMRRNYIAGKLMPPYIQRHGFKVNMYCLATLLGLKKDSMGRWYSIEDFEKTADEFGLTVAFYGSMYYPYRFHVVLKKTSIPT